MKKIALLATHVLALAAGFALGIYALPILTAPEAPPADAVRAQLGTTQFEGRFRRDLKDSDALHWGEGTVLVNASRIGLVGELSPGPDYKLYLSPQFVETEADFKSLKPQMVRVGDIKTFHNFVLPVPPGVDPARYTTAVVWCETFSQFISAAQYR